MIEARKEAGQLAEKSDRRKCSDKEHLGDMRVDRKTSMVAQKLADLPPAQFQQVREGASTITRCDDLQYLDGPHLPLHQIFYHLP